MYVTCCDVTRINGVVGMIKVQIVYFYKKIIV